MSMFLDSLMAIAFLTAVTLSGTCALFILTPRGQEWDLEEWLPISFGLGLGIQCLFFLGQLQLLGQIYFIHFIIFLLGIFGVTALTGRSRWGETFHGPSFYEFPQKQRFLYGCVGTFIVIYIGMSLSSSIRNPYIGYDAKAIWLFKAKILFHEGTLSSSAFHDPDRVHYHRDYPLLIPIAQMAIFRVIGVMDEMQTKILSFLSLIFLVTFFFHTTKRWTSPSIALFFTLLFISTPTLLGRHEAAISSGGTDITFAFYAFLAHMLIVRSWREGAPHLFYIAAILIGCSMLTKNEGIVIFAAAAGALVFQYLVAGFKAPFSIKHAFAGLGVVVLMWLSWQLVKAGLPNLYDEEFGLTLEHHSPSDLWKRTPNITAIVWSTISDAHVWACIWFLFAASLPAGIYLSIKDRSVLVLSIVLLWLAAYTFVYYVTPLNVEFHMRTSIDRLLIQIFPLALIHVALVHHRFMKRLYPGDAADA